MDSIRRAGADEFDMRDGAGVLVHDFPHKPTASALACVDLRIRSFGESEAAQRIGLGSVTTTPSAISRFCQEIGSQDGRAVAGGSGWIVTAAPGWMGG